MHPNTKYQEMIQEAQRLQINESALKDFFGKFKLPSVRYKKKQSKEGKKLLKAAIREKNKQNPNSLLYYFHNFKYYFSGFSIASAIFLILFLFGVINLSRPTNFPEKVASITPLHDQALGDLATLSAQLQWELFNQNSTDEIFAITDKEIPKLPKQVKIYKKMDTPPLVWNALNKKINFEELKLQPYNDYLFKNISLENEEGSRLFVDLEWGEASLSLLQDNVADLGTIKKQLSSFGIGLHHYDSPEEVFSDYSDPSGIQTFFVPKLLDGWRVYESSNAPAGAILQVKEENNALVKLENLDIASYLSSKYPLSIDKKNIIQQLNQEGISTLAPAEATKLEKGNLVYFSYNNYYLPAIQFKLPGEQNKNIFVVLY